MSEYELFFGPRVTTVRVAAEMEVKFAFTSVRFPVSDIAGFFVIDTRYPQPHHELVIAHLPAGARRTKIVRVFVSAGSAEFAKLMSELAQLRPQADLRRLSKTEALRQMGASDTTQVAFTIAALLLGLYLASNAPEVIHFFDWGSQAVDAGEVQTIALQSRNLNLSGEWDEERAMQLGNPRSGGKFKYLFAVFPANRAHDGEVPALLLTEAVEPEALSRLARASPWRCTARNALWEKIPANVSAYFETELGLRVTPRTLLCEMGPSPVGTRAAMALGVLLALVRLSRIVQRVRGR